MSALAYTRAELAEALGCSLDIVDRLTRDGRIPHVRLTAHKPIYPKRQVDEWLADEARASTILAEIEADARGAA